MGSPPLPSLIRLDTVGFSNVSNALISCRCFVLIEMSTVEDIAEQDNLLIENMSAQENMLGMGMLSTVQTVLMQSSPKMFEVSRVSMIVFLKIFLFESKHV